MSSSLVEMEVPAALDVKVTRSKLSVALSDGRTIAVPLLWFPRLKQATRDERLNWRVVGGGRGIHWQALDEDISVEGLLAGRRSGESQESLSRWLTARQRAKSA